MPFNDTTETEETKEDIVLDVRFRFVPEPDWRERYPWLADLDAAAERELAAMDGRVAA